MKVPLSPELIDGLTGPMVALNPDKEWVELPMINQYIRPVVGMRVSYPPPRQGRMAQERWRAGIVVGVGSASFSVVPSAAETDGAAVVDSVNIDYPWVFSYLSQLEFAVVSWVYRLRYAWEADKYHSTHTEFQPPHSATNFAVVDDDDLISEICGIDKLGYSAAANAFKAGLTAAGLVRVSGEGVWRWPTE